MGWLLFLNFCRFIVIYIYLFFFMPSAQRKAPAAGFSLAGALFLCGSVLVPPCGHAYAEISAPTDRGILRPLS